MEICFFNRLMIKGLGGDDPVWHEPCPLFGMMSMNPSLKSDRDQDSGISKEEASRIERTSLPETASSGHSSHDWKKQFTGGKEDQLNAALLFAGPV